VEKLTSLRAQRALTQEGISPRQVQLSILTGAVTQSFTGITNVFGTSMLSRKLGLIDARATGRTFCELRRHFLAVDFLICAQ
jgi:hypothetical protein